MAGHKHASDAPGRMKKKTSKIGKATSNSGPKRTITNSTVNPNVAMNPDAFGQQAAFDGPATNFTNFKKNKKQQQEQQHQKKKQHDNSTTNDDESADFAGFSKFRKQRRRRHIEAGKATMFQSAASALFGAFNLNLDLNNESSAESATGSSAHRFRRRRFGAPSHDDMMTSAATSPDFSFINKQRKTTFNAAGEDADIASHSSNYSPHDDDFSSTYSSSHDEGTEGRKSNSKKGKKRSVASFKKTQKKIRRNESDGWGSESTLVGAAGGLGLMAMLAQAASAAQALLGVSQFLLDLENGLDQGKDDENMIEVAPEAALAVNDDG